MLCIAEFVLNLFMLWTMKDANENVYSLQGKYSKFLK